MPESHNHTQSSTSVHSNDTPALRLVAWETTRNCNLSCVHCRASATSGPYEDEISTQNAFQLLEDISEVAKPIIILTGGEPLLRPDIFRIAKHGSDLGLRMVMAPNGTLVTRDIAKKLVESGIKRVSISLDGADADSHDRFRGVPGAFNGALQGIEHFKSVGMDFQINTTITKTNLSQIPIILKLAEKLGAVAHHIFLLVPTGRGKYIVDQAIDAEQYEATLNWFYDQRNNTPLQLKATCAPHYYRILRQRAKTEGVKITYQTHGLDAVTRGCLAGSGFCFISHKGKVQPCGFLDLECGDITRTKFRDIWRNSPQFLKLRNLNLLDGKCGVCEYKKFCGGCRARAYEATGDYLAEEPLCLYKPHSV